MSTRRAVTRGAWLSLLLLGCHPSSTPDAASGDPPPPASVAVVAARAPQAAPSAAALPSGTTSAAHVAEVSPAASATNDVEPSAPAPAASVEAEHVVDPQNRSKPPLESADLTERAHKLFDAIKADDPEIARDFFFPREPFIPLKDVKGADKYWDQLYRVYAADIHQLHRKLGKDLEDAQFVSFELGSTPKWVKPGEEANKIGYFRTFRGKLSYTAAGAPKSFEVRVIISWDNKWYITHLLPFKH